MKLIPAYLPRDRRQKPKSTLNQPTGDPTALAGCGLIAGPVMIGSNSMAVARSA